MTTLHDTATTTARAALLPAPPGWSVHETGRDPDVLAALRPDRPPPSGVVPALVLSTAAAPDPAPADLEDTDEYVDDEGRAVLYRRWSTREAPGVLHESWSWPHVPGAPWLGATMAREDYLEVSDHTEWAAEMVDPDHVAATLGERTRTA